MTRVGFLGVGDMGAPMVSRLLDRGGHDVVLFARRPEVCRDFLSRGAHLASSLPELAEASDVLLTCLFSDAQLRATAFGPDGFLAHLQPGSVLVSHTTGAPSLLDQLAVTAPRIDVVDAAISGSPNDIEQGQLTVMLGGEPSAVEAARAVVSAYADPIIKTGPRGSAMVVKLLNNMLFAANAQLVAAAAAAGQSLGINPHSLLAALDACSGGSAAGAWIQRTGGLTIFEERVAKFVGKDIATAVSVAEEVNADVEFIRNVAEQGPLALSTVG